MAGNWRFYTVDQIKAGDDRAIAIGPFGSRMKADKYVPEGIPVIRGNNISDTRKLVGDLVFVSEETADELRSCNVFPGDLVFPHRGAIGQVGIVPDDESGRYVLSTSLMKLTCNQALVDPLFVFYFFRSEHGRHALLQHASTVGTPGIGQPLSSLRSITVPVPPLPEQRAIAHILGTLDDKIELNRRMNETLEAMARALFKSWFVDFDPVRAKAGGRARQDGARSGQQRKPLNVASDLPWPGAEAGAGAEGDPGLPKPLADLFPARLVDSELGEIPEGWEVKSLDQIARFLNGLALQKYPPIGDRSLPVIKIAQLRAGRVDGADRASADLDPDYVVADGDILFSWSGSLECVLWAGGPGALNQHLFKVTSTEYPRWLCYFGVHHHLDDFRHIAAGKATTMGHIQRHHLSGAKVAVPPTPIPREIDQCISPLFESLWKREVQSRTLAALRDTLLPKLISGELRVKDAEKFVASAV